jgi:hypothetical protein
MGKRKGVFRKLVAFMCSFRHGKVRRSDSGGFTVSTVDPRGAVQVALACNDFTASDEGDCEPEAAVSIAGTAISR